MILSRRLPLSINWYSSSGSGPLMLYPHSGRMLSWRQELRMRSSSIVWFSCSFRSSSVRPVAVCNGNGSTLGSGGTRVSCWCEESDGRERFSCDLGATFGSYSGTP